MTAKELQKHAHQELMKLKSHYIDILDVNRPTSIDAALELSKVVSKLSPLVGNMLEFHIVDTLNKINWMCNGTWVRQDPDFPDATFMSEEITPNVGFEVKAWYPFATEITGRFKISTNLLERNYYDVALIAWLPEFVFWGKPQILDVCIVSGLSVARARNEHYHNPPQYLVQEPQDTSDRTANLMQRNTLGFRFQDSATNKLRNARQYMKTIGMDSSYRADSDYQENIKSLMSRYEYREDTNYAKIDRIMHNGIEQFKTHIMQLNYKGITIRQWLQLLKKVKNGDESGLRLQLENLL